MNRRRARGFTVVEILVAVAITAFGFAAIFSLQIGSMQGNISARDMAAGVNLAERYAEVLRRDAFMWNAGPTTALDYPAARKQAEAGRPPSNWLAKPLGRWHTFSNFPLDHNGALHRDDDNQNGTLLARQRFCVHYRLDALQGNYDGVIRGRVRAIWPRAAMDSQALRDAGICANPGAFDDDANKVANWFSVSVPATIRRHPR